MKGCDQRHAAPYPCGILIASKQTNQATWASRQQISQSQPLGSSTCEPDAAGTLPAFELLLLLVLVPSLKAQNVRLSSVRFLFTSRLFCYFKLREVCRHPYLYAPLQLRMRPIAVAQGDRVPFNTTIFLSVFLPHPCLREPWYAYFLRSHPLLSLTSGLPQWKETAMRRKLSLPGSTATFSRHFPFAKYVWPTRHSRSLPPPFLGEAFRALWSAPYSSCCESRVCRSILQ